MWFLVVLLIGQTPPNDRIISTRMAEAQIYETNAACMTDSKRRTAGLAMAGIHGQYLCMYHDEPDSELRKARRASF